MSELKPCPFCGKPARIYVSQREQWGYSPEYRAVGCKDCCFDLLTLAVSHGDQYGKMAVPPERVDAELANKWNRRVEVPQ